jgi:hypothetical protein
VPNDDRDHYRPVDPRTQEDVGDVLERAFRREDCREPREAEMRRFLALAEEAERRAEAAESLTEEAERAAAEASERYGRSGSTEDLAAIERWTAAGRTYRREADSLRAEAERLRHYA